VWLERVGSRQERVFWREASSLELFYPRLVVPDCRFSNFLVFCATRDLVTIFEFFRSLFSLLLLLPLKKRKRKGREKITLKEKKKKKERFRDARVVSNRRS